MTLQLESRWREGTQNYVRLSDDSHHVIRLYKARLHQQLVLSPPPAVVTSRATVASRLQYALLKG